jgi:hypothetical protein
MLLDHGKRFVAFFDILGFGSWVESAGSMEVFTYVRGFLNLMIRASLPGSVVHPDMSIDVPESNLGYISFSDSIVFYSRNDSYDCLKTMLDVCGGFMNAVICGPSRMIRGAIAHGEFYVDPEANAYVGKALIDAYRLEGRQDWLALSMHDSLVALPQFTRALAEYPGYIVRPLVSLRDSEEMPYCVNWANKSYLNADFNARRSLVTCYRRSLKSLRGNQEELKKLKRRVKQTREFLIHYNPEAV